MATDGPGLMQGDDASAFCSMVYTTINDRGMLSIDSLIERLNKGEPSRIEEYMRLLGEFIDVACNGSIKKEMWSCHGDEDDPNSYIFNKLKALAASRQALETALNNSTKWLLEYIDPVLSYQAGWGDFGKNHDRYLKICNYVDFIDKYTEKYDTENKAITEILEKLSKEEVKTIEDAKKHREKIIALYDKLKMIGCSRATSDALEEMLRHGWFEEEDYKNVVNHLISNVNTMKGILKNKQDGYVLYQRDDPRTRLRNPLAEHGLGKVIKETNDIFWDNEVIPRAEFKELMKTGTVKPSNMYISGGRLYEMSPAKMLDKYFDDLKDIYFNKWILEDCLSTNPLYCSTIEQLIGVEFLPRMNNVIIFSSIFSNKEVLEELKHQNQKLYHLLQALNYTEKIKLQEEFFKKLKSESGGKLCIVLIVNHISNGNDYQFYYSVITQENMEKSGICRDKIIQVVEV